MSSRSSQGSDGPIVEDPDGDSHRGDPPDFPVQHRDRMPASGSAGSVEVEHGLTADPTLQQGVKHSGRLAPRGFELDLAIQSPAGHQRAEAVQVAGCAGVGGELIGEVQRVDPRSPRAVEPRRMEGDGLVVTLRPDADDDAARRDVLDGLAERWTADPVDDQVEVAADVFDDLGGAETAEELLRCRRVAYQRGDMRAALA